ncbi:aldo/keto reductase [Actinocatenispora rupis]|uniref:Oxidoreductase n=1 Tax=Actinocatenispora rupis TaxID=519421 RepID=A0A8J3J4H8_9ACTN|nr:aldo/keto reductase [Actinocatenispora rupis]GID09984.1 oxidoreductase [Actinocatenispora rupis]
MTTDHPVTTTRRLGRSGLAVSALGMGCWAIGGAMSVDGEPRGYAGTDDQESRSAVLRAVERGVTLFDTADAYGAGHSERLLGAALHDRPDVLVATKFGNVIDEQRRRLVGHDVSPGHVRRALAASLRRLRRDRIDLYQIHTPDVSAAQADDLVAVLEECVAAGTVRWWGVSTDDPVKAAWYARGPHCTAMQVQLNVLDDNRAMLDLCAEYDLGVLCRSPLAMGLLGGRYDAASTLPDDDIRGRQPEWLRWFRDGRPDPAYLGRLDAVRAQLTADGRSLAQGALGWIWAHDERAVPLPGFRDRGQVDDNTGALAYGPLSVERHDAVEAALDRR